MCSDKLDTGYLQKELNERLEQLGDWKVEVDDKDKYSLNVKLTLPPFVPALDETTGELWYVCTRKGVDLQYQIRDDQYVFRGDKELIELLFETGGVIDG